MGNADRAESGSADIGCRDLIRKAEFYKPDINALRLMAAPGLLVASAEIPGLRIDLRQHLADVHDIYQEVGVDEELLNGQEG